jgi:hypothetical protein
MRRQNAAAVPEYHVEPVPSMMCPFTITMSNGAPWLEGPAAPVGFCGKSVLPKESINKQTVAMRIAVLALGKPSATGMAEDVSKSYNESAFV